MGKRIWLFFVIVVLTLSTGCSTLLSGISQPTSVGPSLDEISTLSALATQANLSPTLDISIPLMPTSTPFLELEGQGGEATSENISSGDDNPIKTAMPGEIKITGISQK